MKNNFVNPALFKLEQKKGRSAFIWFSTITAVLVFVACALYSFVAESLAELDVLSNLGFSMANMAEYFNAEALEMWIFPVVLFVACASISAVTSEFRNGSFELIYSLNMSRCEIVRTKFVKVLLDAVVINLIAFGFSVLGLAIFSPEGIFISQLLVYLLIAIAVSVEVEMFVFAIALIGKKRINHFTGVIVSLLFYLFAGLKGVGANGSTEFLGYFSPLSSVSGTIITNGFSGIFAGGIVLAVWGVVSLLMLLIATRKFRTDDLC